ncbi:hypothetical protein QFZ20_002197 [Flavobacterium sp. W4I14]|nr:hypothetical protein [Flavobacterium sp. W4I14]
MKLGFKTGKKVKLNSKLSHDIILKYLKISEYRVIEDQGTFLVFIESEFKERPASRSDYYTKVNSGKFVFEPENENTGVVLHYNISIFWEFIVLSITLAFAICVDIMAIMLTIVFLINFLVKMYYINFVLLNDIFDEQVEAQEQKSD